MRSDLLDVSLLPPGSHVLCAVSGGADSVCLLSLLREYGEVTLSCAHFNHGLRGEESDRDERFVRELCARWDIPFYAGRWELLDGDESRDITHESEARAARYAFLQETAARCRADRIATAHTANDNAETVLFRLARGTTLHGLGGIPEQRDNIVRPLLHATRREVEAYLRERGIPHVEDSTNGEDKAARNRLRHGAVPVLESVNSAAVKNIDGMTARLREDEAYLRAEAEKAFAALWDGESLSLPELCALPRALGRRVLYRAAGRTLTREECEAVFGLWGSASPSATVDLAGLRFGRRYERLVVCPKEETMAEIAPRVLRAGETLVLEEAGYTICADILPPGQEVHSSFNTFSFFCGMIHGVLSVTSRREGDSIRLAHRPGKRSLRRLMIDAKIPRQLRGLIPVLRDEEGVLAVYGFGQSERAMGVSTEAQLRVSVRKNSEKREIGGDQP